MNATVTQDMFLFALIGSASLPVQLVMTLLLVTSFSGTRDRLGFSPIF